jgi:hypothetical protein
MDFKNIITGKICPYCNCTTELVLGDIIYPHKVLIIPRPKYLDKWYYRCVENVDHYVGTYSDNKTSLGRLADNELRIWKNKGHNIFDPLWRDKKLFKSQREAYKWLSKKMEIPLEHTHFGMFTIEQCQQAINFCEQL